MATRTAYVGSSNALTIPAMSPIPSPQSSASSPRSNSPTKKKETSEMYDLEIALVNRRGSLAEMGEALGRASVSIEGGGVFVTEGRAVAHFLFADGAAARRAL